MSYFICPNCQGLVEIIEVNCGIFRHAIYKDGNPVNPHMTQAEYEKNKDKILGCGLPFQFFNGSLVKCAWI